MLRHLPLYVLMHINLFLIIEVISYTLVLIAFQIFADFSYLLEPGSTVLINITLSNVALRNMAAK